MDLPTFLQGYPEFAKADRTLVNAKLVEVGAQLDASVWGTHYDAGHGLLTAHRLAISPFGQNARMVARDGTTTYEREFKKLQRTVSYGYRVV